MYFPEGRYEIDLLAVDQTVIDKAKEIINGEDYPDKLNYYKIGKFVYSHIIYDSLYVGKNLTVKEIYDGKKGVCEHYILLYNAMLNAIGKKRFIFLDGLLVKMKLLEIKKLKQMLGPLP